MGIWEQMKEHSLFDLREIDRQFTKTSYLIEGPIAYCEENRYQGDHLGYSTPSECEREESTITYEPDFSEVIANIPNEELFMSDKPNLFITNDQAQLNFEFYIDQLNTPNLGYKNLVAIRKTVLEAQKEENGGFFFPKGQSKVFWAQYQVVKAEVVVRLEEAKLQRERVFNEIMDIIEKVSNLRECNQVKREIFDNKILFYTSKTDDVCKKTLFEAAQTKADELGLAA